MNSKQRARTAPRGVQPRMPGGKITTLTADDPRHPHIKGDIQNAYLNGSRYQQSRIETMGAMNRYALIELGAEMETDDGTS